MSQPAPELPSRVNCKQRRRRRRQAHRRPAPRFLVSPEKRRAIIEAIISPLIPYPRGYARSKWGPFFHHWTIEALLRDGTLRRTAPRLGAKSPVSALSEGEALFPDQARED